MNTKKGVSFFLVIVALITGNKLIKHIDFQNWKFEKPAIDTVYLIAFVGSVVFIVKEIINRFKK